MSGCRLVNVHTYRPQGPLQFIFLVLCYFPCLVALGIMLGCMIPYFYAFIGGVVLPSGHPFLLMYCVVGAMICFSLLLTSYGRAVFTAPGYADGVWCDTPRVHRSDGTVEIADGSNNKHVVTMLCRDGEPRYCLKCKVYKPDGSHHCGDCNRCVLDMDHHCPWINNCVGRRNEKFFFLFIGYVPVCGLHICLSIIIAYRTLGMSVLSGQHSMGSHLATVLIFIVSCVVAIVLFCFSCFHLFLVIHDEKTIERRIAQLTGKALPERRMNWCKKLVYRLSGSGKVMKSLTKVLGHNRWAWALPVAPVHHEDIAEGSLTETDLLLSQDVPIKQQQGSHLV